MRLPIPLLVGLDAQAPSVRHNIVIAIRDDSLFKAFSSLQNSFSNAIEHLPCQNKIIN
jgi:hypothetical protein